MTPTIAVVLLVLVAAVAFGLVALGIHRFGIDAPLVYVVWLVAPPIQFWLMWAALGRQAPLRTMLLIGVCAGLIAAAGWRLRRWEPVTHHMDADDVQSADRTSSATTGRRFGTLATRQGRRRYRYQVIATGVMSAAGVTVGGLLVGLAQTPLIMLALVVTLASLATALLAWLLFRDRWRAQGWEW